MRARILQQNALGNYEMIWCLYGVPGSTVTFQQCRIDCESLQLTRELHAHDWNEYVSFETEGGVYPFPLMLSLLDSMDGNIHIDLPASLLPGRYSKKFRLYDARDADFPLWGASLYGMFPYAAYVSEQVDWTTLPVIRADVKTGTVISGITASSFEKQAVIAVLQDWILDATNAHDEVASAINALTTESSADDIYSAYLLAQHMQNNLDDISLTSALYSVYLETLS